MSIVLADHRYVSGHRVLSFLPDPPVRKKASRMSTTLGRTANLKTLVNAVSRPG